MCCRNAGFFIFIDLSPWLRINHEDGEDKEVSAEQALAQKLLDGGVSVQPGEEHFDRPGWFRIVFSCDREVLEVGLERYVTFLSFM